MTLRAKYLLNTVSYVKYYINIIRDGGILDTLHLRYIFWAKTRFLYLYLDTFGEKYLYLVPRYIFVKVSCICILNKPVNALYRRPEDVKV